MAILTVTGAARSASWYERVFQGKEPIRYVASDGAVQVVLSMLDVGLELCSVSRPLVTARSSTRDELV